MLTAIKASWLVDGVRNSVVPDGVVLLDGDKIAEIGTQQGMVLGSAVEVLNAAGCTILPGLIDCHVHLSFNGEVNAREDMINASNDELYRLACANAAEALRSGVTTVRDCGARDDVAFRLKQAIGSGEVIGPRVLISGRPLTSMGGHCYFMNGEVASGEEMSAMIASQFEAGADFVKVMASGGGMTPGTNPRKAQFSVSQLSLAVEEAARRGSWVTAHAQGTESIDRCAAARLHGVEHCAFLGAVGNPCIDEGVLSHLVMSGATAIPTLAAEFLILQAGAKLTLFEDKPGAGQSYFEAKLAVATALREAGVPIVAGSDAGVPGSRPSAVLIEIELLARIGMSPMEAIQAATSKAAQFLGIEPAVGTIQKGKQADLLVVKGNPIESPKALSTPVAVFKDGRVAYEQCGWPLVS